MELVHLALWGHWKCQVEFGDWSCFAVTRRAGYMFLRFGKDYSVIL
jgi:hypothetical protein